MQNRIITTMLLTLVFAVGTFAPLTRVQAAYISNEQVEEQKMVLNESVRNLLLEELKLVQMIFIQLLEERIADLEA